MACNSSLPTLQDMLLPDIEIDEGTLTDAEFDASKLEELAESLLADITADLEAGDRESNTSAAEIASGAERLLGSVVGTTTKCLESSQYTGPDQNGSGLNTNTTTTAPIESQQHLLPSSTIIAGLHTPELALENKLEKETKSNRNNAVTIEEMPSNSIVDITSTLTATETKSPGTTSTTPDTVYGTYDAKTNSITVVMDDVAVPVNEVVEEIYWDGARSEDTRDEDDDMIYTSSSSALTSGMTSPSQVYLNVTTCSDDDEAEDDNCGDDDFNFDPIATFLCPKRPLVSPLAKSPAPSLHSATSDHGYESILGSPPSHYEPLSEDLTNDFSDWPPDFNELFPSLI